MNAKLIVRSMLEADEQPEDFIQRQGGETDGERVMLEPKFGYDFNIGEGNYRCGIAFTVKANSEEEALYVANRYLSTIRGSHEDIGTAGNPAAIVNRIDRQRAYVDDDCVATAEDIVDRYPLEHYPDGRG